LIPIPPSIISRSIETPQITDAKRFLKMSPKVFISSDKVVEFLEDLSSIFEFEKDFVPEY
jgi:hypothetical protein